MSYFTLFAEAPVSTDTIHTDSTIEAGRGDALVHLHLTMAAGESYLSVRSRDMALMYRLYADTQARYNGTFTLGDKECRFTLKHANLHSLCHQALPSVEGGTSVNVPLSQTCEYNDV